MGKALLSLGSAKGLGRREISPGWLWASLTGAVVGRHAHRGDGGRAGGGVGSLPIPLDGWRWGYKVILWPSILQRQHASIKWGKQSDSSLPDVSKFQAFEFAKPFRNLSEAITELCTIIKVNRDKCELRPTSCSLQTGVQGRACFPSQTWNKFSLGKPALARSFYLNENVMLRMLNDPETVSSLPTWFQLFLALFSATFRKGLHFCSQDQVPSSILPSGWSPLHGAELPSLSQMRNPHLLKAFSMYSRFHSYVLCFAQKLYFSIQSLSKMHSTELVLH